MTFEELMNKRWTPVWAPEDETGGADTATADTADTGGEDTGATGDGGEGADVANSGIGNADEDTGTAASDDNQSKDSEQGTDDDGDDTVPEEYEVNLDLPEGMEVDEAMAAAMTPAFKEAGLTQKQADVLMKAYADRVGEQHIANGEAVQNMLKGWVDTAKKDAEIGNDNWQESVRLADSVIRQFGTPELVQKVMVEHGVGNHPEMIRIFARIGRHVADDSFVSGDTTDNTAIPREQAWYGETTPLTKKG